MDPMEPETSRGRSVDDDDDDDDDDTSLVDVDIMDEVLLLLLLLPVPVLLSPPSTSLLPLIVCDGRLLKRCSVPR
jgi:hypothetical protein